LITWKNRQLNTKLAGVPENVIITEQSKMERRIDAGECSGCGWSFRNHGAAHGSTQISRDSQSTEVHLVRSDDASRHAPMTLEEAIKEAHFRDRDYLSFRDPKGKLMILHAQRRKNGVD